MTVKHKYSTIQVIAVAAVILLVAGWRVTRAVYHPEWQNFSPVMAMAFCGGLFLPGALAWIFPFAVLVISDAALSLAMQYPVFGWGQTAAWICYAAGVGAGRWLAGKESLNLGVFGGLVVGNALLFYVVTNFASWLSLPEYPKNIGGLVQALTVGLPGFPPTWLFFRNSLASDFLFAGLILAVRALAVRALALRTSSEPALARS